MNCAKMEVSEKRRYIGHTGTISDTFEIVRSEVLLLGWMEAPVGVDQLPFDLLDLFCGQQAMSQVW